MLLLRFRAAFARVIARDQLKGSPGAPMLQRLFAAAHDPLRRAIQVYDALKAAAGMDAQLTVGPGKMLVGGPGGRGLRLLRHGLELRGLLKIVFRSCRHGKVGKQCFDCGGPIKSR